ncbi:MAG: VOC family protein [Acidobacteriota bacterium]|nr:VOC family protein [Acidobacteriota bacterium]
MKMPPFHLAFPVTDLDASRSFYTENLGCKMGRSDDRWIDFDFFGHQITCHLVEAMPVVTTNHVDGKNVPSSHFGAILDWDAWHELSDRLRNADTDFLIEPYIRFRGEPGEQATLFLTDPSGNGLEFKSFKNPGRVFSN